MDLPPPLPGTELRILATSDLGAATVPLRTSWGEAGTAGGVVAALERERARGPAIWLDAGDLVVGSPAYALLGERPWDEVADLPIAAAGTGNHEFDDGMEALHDAAARLSFPLLCANADAGLEPAVTVDTDAAPVGVVGLTHPRCHELTSAPQPFAGWAERVAELARELRASGARWIVALLHDGVEWWPDGDGAATRADRLGAVARPWAAHVDLILCGHNFAAWMGELGGTPAGQPHVFAASMVVADLGERVAVRGAFPVPPVRPGSATPATRAIDAAAGRVVGETPHAWLARTGSQHYLPALIARGFRVATGADAAFVLPAYHGTQGAVGGTIAAIGPGPVSELDLLRMCASPGYDPVVAELRPGELQAAVAAHWAAADPRNTATDGLVWNWCRLPAGTDAACETATTVAMLPGAVPLVSEWLGRDVDAAPAGVTALDAMAAAL